jgi:hypothetical protein
MNTLKDVKAKVRSLVGDTMGDWTSDAYLIPLINQVYESQTTQLMSETGSSFDEQVRDVPNVPLGTTSLTKYQQPSMDSGGGGNVVGPLYGLMDPIVVEWKQLNQPDNYYVEAGRTAKLPNVSPAAPGPPYTMSWEWRGSIVYLTPMIFAVDLRVRGEFSPAPLLKDTDILTVNPRMGAATAFGTAGLIGRERNNAGYAEGYLEQAAAVLDDIANTLVRAEQGTTARIGRGSGRR